MAPGHLSGCGSGGKAPTCGLTIGRAATRVQNQASAKHKAPVPRPVVAPVAFPQERRLGADGHSGRPVCNPQRGEARDQQLLPATMRVVLKKCCTICSPKVAISAVHGEKLHAPPKWLFQPSMEGNIKYKAGTREQNGHKHRATRTGDHEPVSTSV